MDDNVKPFSANTGWFSRFLKRYNFHNIKITREPASADTGCVTVWNEAVIPLTRKYAVLNGILMLCDSDLNDFLRKVSLA
jgi:hypothetical protein